MNKNIRLGIFVVVGLVIFVVALYYLGSQTNLFGSQIEVSAVFKNASGIQPGSNIRLAGVKIGTVKDVTINSDSSVTVSMMLDESSAQFVKKDATVSIGSEGIMGNKIINISDGSVEAGQVEDGDELQANNQADLDNIMTSVLNNSKNLEDITNNLMEVTERITKGEGAVGKLLFDKSLETKMNNVIVSLEETGENTVALTGRLQNIVVDLENGKGMAGKLLSDKETARQFDVMMDSLKRVSQEAGVIANKLAEFSTMLNNQQGPLNRLLTDTLMAENLEQTIANARKRSAELEETIKVINNSWLLNLFSGNKKDKKEERNELDEEKGQRSASVKTP